MEDEGCGEGMETREVREKKGTWAELRYREVWKIRERDVREK